MIYTLPPLPYATDALEPRISQETMNFHYGKHLQTYIDNLNRLIEGTQYEDTSLEHIILTATGPVFNNAAQVWNHTFFFNSLTPDPEPMPLELKDYLIRDFGSVETFKENFKKAATDIFGSGWAWLAQDSDGRLHIIQESNAGNPLRAGYKPLLTIDVWEHAYYIDYRDKRAAFVDCCWELINWQKVVERMHKSAQTARITDLTEKVTVIAETDRNGLTEAIEEVIEEDEEVENDMQRYVCVVCGWVYDPVEGDPDSGIAPGTPFKDIPDDWTCPACGVDKKYFEPER